MWVWFAIQSFDFQFTSYNYENLASKCNSLHILEGDFISYDVRCTPTLSTPDDNVPANSETVVILKILYPWI